MMLGRSVFDDDPFFASHREQMRQMDSLMQNSFGFHNNLLGITDGRQGNNHQDRHPRRNNELAMPSLFGNFGMMFENMRNMMNDMHRSFGTQISSQPSNPDAHVFTQSSYYSMTNTGQGEPKVYQATTSTRQVPGGIKETRKAVRDSETGVERVAVGHHIRDRAHIVERERNRRTGDQAQNQEFINLDESEAGQFDEEWQEKTRQAMRGLEYSRRGERSRQRAAAAITDGRQQHHHSHGARQPPRGRPSYRDRE